MPWYTAFGNHDGLVQGNFPHTSLVALDTVARGNTKLVSPPAGVSQADLLAALGGDLATLLNGLSLAWVRRVTPDDNRRLLDKKEFIAEHFVTTGASVGHGFTEQNRTDGTGHYMFDQGPLRFLVLDTVNPNGEYDGSVGRRQFAWVNWHTHDYKIWGHARADGSGGLWEINTASHVDFPQQSRQLGVARAAGRAGACAGNERPP